MLLFKKNRNNLNIIADGDFLPSFKEFFGVIITFTLTVFAWIFFRAENISHAISYIGEIFSPSLLSIPQLPKKSLIIVALVAFFMIIEWIGRENAFAIEKLKFANTRVIRWCFYSFIIYLIGMFMQTSQTDFIYFQF
ncbi:hypothetical protein [Cyclobacterium qasimii]|uniref:Putative poly(Beta-D-mannuronate) O-acetylase n=1 Tax=Cyclobacterium qasimii M12-11B TaxID=641524 RepID=S7V9S1_9BACT|nr:hypothetical protein [Cyclobacterium qasimii]EPR66317.1 putative poly(beta-D-mannuronate) O-acetylase [Cyclobacterium qasimii M12-11B]